MGQTSLVLTFARGAVWAWTAEHYEADVEQPMAQRDPFREDVLDFAHSMMATAQDCEIDKQGRIRVPPPLRERAGLEKDCVVHVLLGHIEIWDRATWDQRFEESLNRTAGRSGMPGPNEGPNEGPGE